MMFITYEMGGKKEKVLKDRGTLTLVLMNINVKGMD